LFGYSENKKFPVARNDVGAEPNVSMAHESTPTYEAGTDSES